MKTKSNKFVCCACHGCGLISGYIVLFVAISKGLDDGARPLYLAMVGTMFAHDSQVRATVMLLEAERPELVVEMLSACRICKLSEVDGSVKVGKRTLYDPTKRRAPASLFTTCADGVSANEDIVSAAAVAISAEHAYTFIAKPITEELPRLIFSTIVAEPMSELAANWRNYARHSFIPGVMKITALLEAHASVLGWPDPEWQNTKFPVLRQLD
eukprot:SAG31_NODE_63_length_28659_cov_23.074685_2_plen_213_part_00